MRSSLRTRSFSQVTTTNRMPNPLTILPPVPTRGQAYAGVLQQVLATQQANKQQAETEAKAKEDARTNAVKTALSPYMAQPQLLARALQLLPPEDRQRAQRIGIGSVPPMENPEQILARTKAAAQTQDITGQQAPPDASMGAPVPPVNALPPAPPPPPMSGGSPTLLPQPSAATPSQVPDNPPIGMGGGLGATPPVASGPTPNDIVDAKARHFEAIYGHAPAAEQIKQWYDRALLGAQGQVTAAQMATKIVPTAQEGITNAAAEKTFNQVTLPKSQADVANVKSETTFRQGPQTAETIAKTTEAKANTGKIGAETTKIGQETAALVASNDPVVKTALARSLVQGVLTDPQSFYALPTEDKKLVVGMLRRAPSKMSAAENDQINASANGLNLLKDAREIVDKWSKRGIPITGPVLGRYEEGANKFGDAIIPSNVPDSMKAEWAQDISKMHEWLTVLPILETKGLVGSRPAKEVISGVASVTPSLSKATDFFNGAMAGTEQRLQERQKTLTAKQWGGQPPVLDGATASSPSSAIQTYIGTDGKIHVR